MIRAKLKLVRHIALAIILLGLILCGAEVGVRVYEVAHGKPVCAPPGEAAIDPSRLSVPSWLTNVELKPHAAASVRSRDQKRAIEIRTNSLGLRGPEVVVPKPPDVYRIVVLGDETIFAPETSDDDHLVYHLRNLLQRSTRLQIEVVNAGVPEACPLTEYLLFKQKLLALQPNLVLMHFDWSDVADDRQLRRRLRSDPRGTPLSCPHASLRSAIRKPHPLDRVREQFRLVDWGLFALGNQWKQQISEQAAVSRDTGMNPYAWLRQEHPESDVTVRQAFQPIADVARLSQGGYCQLVVVTSPKPWQVSARCSCGAGTRLKSGVSADACYLSRAPFEALAAYAAELNVPFADLSDALVNVEKPETSYWRYAPRWSAQGHRRAAEFLATILVERVPGPWNSRYFQQDVQQASQIESPGSEIRWAGGAP